MSNQEHSIQQALESLDRREYRSVAQAAIAYGVPKSTLAHRRAGRRPRDKSDLKSQRLTHRQEDILVQWIEDLQKQHLSPNYEKIRYVATQLLRENNDFTPLGAHWVTRFLQRHKGLKAGRSKAMEIERLLALDHDIVHEIFSEVERLEQRYRIPPRRVRNMDEKGFQMGQNRGDYVVFPRSAGAALAPTTGVTSWVTVIEYTNAEGLIGTPFVINAGKEPETDWWPPNIQLPNWIWAFSPKGWTDNELGLRWLKELYIPEIQRIDGLGNHSILILDGHDSHETGEFQWECLQANIHLVYLPAHASHKLQPLDCGPFSPLATYYSTALQKYTPTGYAGISRATFTTLYDQVRSSAFSKRNIRAGWKRSGWFPRDISRILNDPDIRDIRHATPDFQVPTNSNDLYHTPHKLYEYQSAVATLERMVPTEGRVILAKLESAAIQELSARTIAETELKLVRLNAVNQELRKRSKRVQKQKSQRTFNLEQVLQARDELAVENRRSRPRQRTKKAIESAISH